MKERSIRIQVNTKNINYNWRKKYLLLHSRTYVKDKNSSLNEDTKTNYYKALQKSKTKNEQK